MMNFDEFVNEVLDNVREYLPEEYEHADISACPMEKLNGEYVALQVRRPNEMISASINLSKAYEFYSDGAELQEVMNQIAEMAQMQPPGLDMNALMDYDHAKEQLFVRVSGLENNRTFLETVPYTQVDNLAITYHICIANEENGLASAAVTNSVMENFGITKEQLHQDAMENSQKLFPANIQPMMNVMMRMAGMMPEAMADPEGRSFDDQLSEIDFDGDMFVLSNATNQNGASALFYPEVLEKIGEQTGQNFFILPSSIHETLIVPDDGRFDYQTLESMVKEINEAEVAPEERLSNTVYHYDSKERLFERAEVYEMRQMSKELDRDHKPSINDQLKSAERECSRSMSSAVKEKENDIGLE